MKILGGLAKFFLQILCPAAVHPDFRGCGLLFDFPRLPAGRSKTRKVHQLAFRLFPGYAGFLRVGITHVFAISIQIVVCDGCGSIG